MVTGDFNIAPDDRDVYDPAKFVGATHVSPPERARLRALAGWGLADVFRQPPRRRERCTRGGTTAPATSTRAAACGSTSMLATAPVAERVEWCVIDRNARKGKLPSDHAPVVVDLAA